VNVAFSTSSAPYENSKSLGSGTGITVNKT
jgi:hypothetical protein